jgi:acetyltransferase-like isoleucine patch superfamily enzyme
MKSFFLTLIQLAFTFFVYALGMFFFALALVPAVALVLEAWALAQGAKGLARYFIIGAAIGAGYFIFGFCLIMLVGLARRLFGLRLKEGTYAIPSWGAVNWALNGCLKLIIDITFSEFILLTPFANVLLRLLGAKLGKNVQINSKNIADASLLEIGDNTLIGGGATIICHAAERGKLKLKKVKIGSNVTVGLNAVILPGSEIGDHAVIGAAAVLLKDTKVEPHSVYVGVPAEAVKPHHKEENKNA